MPAETELNSSDFSLSSSSSSSDADATSSDDENDPTICSLCLSCNSATTEISDCKELKSIKDYIESSTVRKVKFACQTCLYKLYTVIDQNRLKAFREEREHRLATVAALIESTGASLSSTLNVSTAVDNTAATSSAGSTKEVDQIAICDDGVGNDSSSVHRLHGDDEGLAKANELLDKGEKQVKENTKMNDKNLREPNDVDPQKQPNLNRITEVVSDPSSSPSHLDVMYERTESAFITESGGTLDQYKNPPLQCRYCPKVFVLRKPFNKHMRSHQCKLMSTRSGSTSRGRITPTNIIYACTDCSATFDSSAKLKTHCRIHLKRYYCIYCHKENLSLFDHDFHEAECKGIQMAKEQILDTRRVTRSIARSTRSVQSEKTPNKLDIAKSDKTAKSERTWKSMQSRRSSAAIIRNYANDDVDDDDDGATSMAYTDYTALNSYVAKWVAGTCRSDYGNKSLSRLGKPLQCMDQRELIVSQKEYDIIMLERLLIQSELNVYSCCVSDCDYVTNTLREMCLHEIVIHKFKTYYSCRKCRGVFTSKLFLDYHFYMQNYAEYHCNKCSMICNYEYQLQYHLIQHQQNDAFPCLYCANSYMSSQELRIHCLETGHDPKKRKKTISIDHTMNIVNETAPEPPPPKRTYKCTINIMDLPKMPTKRPMHVIWPKGRNIFLGDIDFEYQPRRNCVRTKYFNHPNYYHHRLLSGSAQFVQIDEKTHDVSIYFNKHLENNGAAKEIESTWKCKFSI